jgi:hypothetical protein
LVSDIPAGDGGKNYNLFYSVPDLMEDDDMANLVDLSNLDASLRDILVGVPVPVLGVGLSGHLHLLPVW